MPARRARTTPNPPKDALDRALRSLGVAPESLQAVFEDSPDLVFVVDRDRRVSYVNRPPKSGAAGTVLGRDACDFVRAEDRETMAAALARVFVTGAAEDYEVRGTAPDGRAAVFSSRVTPMRHAGAVTAALITSVDVTERRRAERTQAAIYRISEAAHAAPTLQELFAAIHGIVGELMPAQNFYIALHDPVTDTISFPYFVDEVDPPPEPKKPSKGLTEYVLRTGLPLLTPPGGTAELERLGEVELIGAPSIDWLGVPLKTTHGATIGALVVQSYREDVRYGEAEQRILEFVSTQVAMAIAHKRVEEGLRESERTLKTLLDAIPEAAVLMSADGAILAANRTLLGDGAPDVPQLVGHSAFEYSVPDLAEERRRRIAQVVFSGEPAVWEDYSPVSGRTHVNHVYPVRDEAGRVTRVAVVALDITERKRAEEALRRSEEQYRTLVENAQDVIFALAPDATIAALNPAFETLTGHPREAWLGRPFVGLLHEDDVPFAADLYRRVLRREPRLTMQLRFRTAQGSYLIGEVHAGVHAQDDRVIGVLGIVRDITDRVRLEDQLRQAQKMEAVGRLAGGVAHDFNNLLTAIGGYSDLLLADLALGDPRRADVEEIKKAAERAAALTRQLLAFSRRQVLQPTVVDVNAVVAGAEKLLRRLIGEDIRLATRLAPDLGAVRADAGQLEQVVMNLAVNAREAMRGGGELTVETRNVEFPAARRTDEQAAVPPGSYVELAVRDTGAGMDEETKRHLFEPFFTTREQGRGTGLGLATVYGIVKQSGGFIWVDSAPDRGATFTIHLPLVHEAVDATGAARPVHADVSGTETVLLVEDEPAVRAVAREALRTHGFRVLEAADGQAALRIAADRDVDIDLLLTDVVMPGLGGRALADSLLAERPDVRVLFMSGYSDDALGDRGALSAGLHYLQKPFAPVVLARKVREVLDLPR